MLAHPTLDKLNAMGLAGMAKAFGELVTNGEAEHLSHAEWLGLLLEREWSSRYDRKLAARLRFAKLRHQATPEDVDYRSERDLDRALFMKLLGGDWIDAHDNLAICGPSGVGKSWLACALGHKAYRDDRSVLYQRVPRLFAQLAGTEVSYFVSTFVLVLLRASGLQTMLTSLGALPAVSSSKGG